jgi:hypothetical protein
MNQAGDVLLVPRPQMLLQNFKIFWPAKINLLLCQCTIARGYLQREHSTLHPGDAV